MPTAAPTVLRQSVKLHRVQAAYRRSTALYRGFVGGIGSGKSWAGAYDLLRRAKCKRLYMAIAPTYVMLKDATLRTFLQLGRELHFIGPDALNKGDMIVTLGNGAEILFRSANEPDRLRGPNLSGIWLDEASLMTRDCYDVAIGRLREQGEQGWLGTTFTPKGLSHWTYDVFGRQQPNTELFHCATKDNPFAPKGFASVLAQQYAGLQAQQELEGRFVNTEGAEWPADYFAGDEAIALEGGANGIWFRDWPADLVLRVLALDPSKSKDSRHGDYAAFALVGLSRDGKLYADADLERRDASRVVEDGLRLFGEWQPQAFAVETNQFLALFASLFAQAAKHRGLMLPLYGINNVLPKPVRIRTVGPYLARRELYFRAGSPGARRLVAQLRDFPCGEHDDGPDALEMAIRTMLFLLGRKPTHGSPEIVRA